MKAKQLAAALRLGHPIQPGAVADEIDRLVAELVALQLVMNGMLNRIKSLPSRGVIDGYSVVRREDAIKCVARNAVEVSDE